jgi:hypothetical protein
MSEPKTLLKRWHLIAVSFIFAAMLAVTALSSSSRTAQSGEPEVVNKTQAFRLISIERQVDSIRHIYLLRLQNVSAKEIVGYTIGFNNGSGAAKDYNSKVIAPGDIEEYDVSTRDVRPQEPIRIAAVVFSDGTSEGEPKAIAFITDERRGRRLFRERVLPLLEKALDSPEVNLDELESQIRALPERVEGESSDVNSSYRDDKSSFLKEMKELKEARAKGRTSYDLRPELQEIKEAIEKLKGRF